MKTETKYNRYTRDFDMLVDGRCVGSRVSRTEADNALRQMRHAILTHPHATAPCAACGGAHHIQNCPAIYARLTAPDNQPDRLAA